MTTYETLEEVIKAYNSTPFGVTEIKAKHEPALYYITNAIYNVRQQELDTTTNIRIIHTELGIDDTLKSKLIVQGDDKFYELTIIGSEWNTDLIVRDVHEVKPTTVQQITYTRV